MATFLLIRHGAHLLGSGTLAGRTEGVQMSPLGYEQVRQMAERVAALQASGRAVRAIYSSPIERCRETARVLGERVGVPVEVREPLAELDLGAWTGRPITELREEELFRRWNTHRSGTRMPGGETMLEVQARIVGEMLRLRDLHGEDTVALVAHGDVIKAAVAYVLGVPLDLLLRIEISLASVSVVTWGAWGPWVLGVNGTGGIVLGD